MVSTRPSWMMAAGGALLMLLALAMVGFNEGSVIAYQQASARHGGTILDAGAQARPNAGQYGRMMRVSGTPRVVEQPRDPQFNVSADLPVLSRKVEMFQWREIRVGGVHYELDWVDHVVDWRRFEVPTGHANPPRLPFAGDRFAAANVRLNGFQLGPQLIDAMPGFVRLQPDFSRLPPNMAASFRVAGDALVTSQEPGSPQLGDVRVSWEGVPLQPVTVVARVDGDRLVASDVGHGRGFELQVGERSLADVLPDLPPAPATPWLWRALALVLGCIGTGLILAGLRQRLPDPYAAVAVAVAVLAALAGVLWVSASYMIGIALLLVALVAIPLARWRLRMPVAS